jgi:hypothetical protein
MRVFLNILAVLFILAGGVWFLQGIDVIRGSYMTGRSEWALYGGIAFLVGIAMLVLANRRRPSPPTA